MHRARAIDPGQPDHNALWRGATGATGAKRRSRMGAVMGAYSSPPRTGAWAVAEPNSHDRRINSRARTDRPEPQQLTWPSDRSGDLLALRLVGHQHEWPELRFQDDAFLE